MRKKGDKIIPDIPTISIDYIFTGTNEFKTKNNTNLVTFDNSSEPLWAHRTGRQQIPPWLVEAMLQEPKDAGYKNVRLCVKSEREKVIKNLKKLIIQARTAETVAQ